MVPTFRTLCSVSTVQMILCSLEVSCCHLEPEKGWGCLLMSVACRTVQVELSAGARLIRGRRQFLGKTNRCFLENVSTQRR